MMSWRQAPHESYNTRVLLAFAAVAVVFSLWQCHAWQIKALSLPEYVAKHALWPAEAAFTAVLGWVHDTGVGLLGTRALVVENRQLKEENDRLRDEKLALVQDALEGRTIRERLGFTSPQAAPGVPAQVIGHSAGGSRRRITIRSAQGRKLEVGNIVREAHGLIGRVIQSDGATAEVILLTDKEHAVAGRIVRSGAEGMVYPALDVDAGPVCLKVEKLTAHADLREGDEVVTSGIGGVYPPGLPIGFVDSVQRAAASTAALTGYVRPYVDLDNLSYVYVVRHSSK